MKINTQDTNIKVPLELRLCRTHFHGDDGSFTLNIEDKVSGLTLGEILIPSEEVSNLFSNRTTKATSSFYPTALKNCGKTKITRQEVFPLDRKLSGVENEKELAEHIRFFTLDNPGWLPHDGTYSYKKHSSDSTYPVTFVKWIESEVVEDDRET